MQVGRHAIRTPGESNLSWLVLLALLARGWAADSLECYTPSTSGIDFAGKQYNRDKNGHLCMDWSSGDLDIYPWVQSTLWKALLALEGTYSHNYCRNPGGTRLQPWCFTAAAVGQHQTISGDWSYCAVPNCSQVCTVNNPCQFGGSCAVYSNQLGYSCTCASGFGGTNCAQLASSTVTSSTVQSWQIVSVVALALNVLLLVAIPVCLLVTYLRMSATPPPPPPPVTRPSTSY